MQRVRGLAPRNEYHLLGAPKRSEWSRHAALLRWVIRYRGVSS
jgi:hypothetical protein